MMNDFQEKDSQPQVTPGSREVLTCEEFQAQMPTLIGSETIREHDHLTTCSRCSALLEELEYIASIAGELMPSAYDPPEGLWHKIESALPLHGQEDRAAGNGHFPVSIDNK